MMKIALTGGLGTGKTEVLKMFRMLGAVTWDADAVVRRELGCNIVLKRKIRKALGDSFFSAGRIDRRRLAQEVFSSRRKLSQLEAFVHPVVKKDLLMFFRRNKKKRVVVAEVPLLFETDFYRFFDASVCVVTRPAVSERRLKSSRGASVEEIARRQRRQMSLSRKIALCDMTIDNNGSRNRTYKQVKHIMEEARGKT
jgi:dephospho-CoA kinase